MCKSKPCPRCQGRMEVFQSHTYCAECNYGECFADVGHSFVVPKWATDAVKAMKPKAIIKLMVPDLTSDDPVSAT